MVRRVTDLDERDLHARVAIRGQLRGRRELWGWSQQKLAENIGHESADVRRIEREGVDQSHTVTVMRWARALGMRLVLDPVGFPPPVAGDPVDDLLADLAGRMQLPGERGDLWAVTQVMQQLVGVRRACGVTQKQLAQLFGITHQSVSLAETAGCSTALVVLQRHARGIARCAGLPDAYLDVHLEDTPLV